MTRTIAFAVSLLFACLALGQDSTVHVTDVPDFRREYRAHIGINGIVLVVDAHRSHWNGEREFYASLEQPDGRWVIFDIERPADKILDRELVPPVIALCKKILSLDRKFLSEGPKEIRDQYGHKWVKVN